MADTLEFLLALQPAAFEIVLVDQTSKHEAEVQQRLEALQQRGAIRWIRGRRPSIPESMNQGALAANSELLLFLDDDIVPDRELVKNHLDAHRREAGELIAGRVLQPWHPDGHDTDPFTKTAPEFKSEFMGGNFSIRRNLLIELGGFDENFRGAAYRYEREFADRLLQAGHRIWYEPAASIRHLHHSTGGTRSKGGHLTSWNPRHPVGAYYYVFMSPCVEDRMTKALSRLLRSVATRHHLKAPWYIPVTLLSELSGLTWALWLRLKGPALPFASKPHAGAAP